MTNPKEGIDKGYKRYKYKIICKFTRKGNFLWLRESESLKKEMAIGLGVET